MAQNKGKQATVRDDQIEASTSTEAISPATDRAGAPRKVSVRLGLYREHRVSILTEPKVLMLEVKNPEKNKGTWHPQHWVLAEGDIAFASGSDGNKADATIEAAVKRIAKEQTGLDVKAIDKVVGRHYSGPKNENLRLDLPVKIAIELMSGATITLSHRHHQCKELSFKQIRGDKSTQYNRQAWSGFQVKKREEIKSDQLWQDENLTTTDMAESLLAMFPKIEHVGHIGQKGNDNKEGGSKSTGQGLSQPLLRGKQGSSTEASSTGGSSSRDSSPEQSTRPWAPV
ncbi:MAG: hypothetical protein Q9162_001974 [Coniocarpon cinnabarinum]